MLRVCGYGDVRDGHFFFFHLIPDICRGAGRCMARVLVYGGMGDGQCIFFVF